MPSLYDLLAEAQDGEAMTRLGRQFGLSPQQTQAAVTALLPAISTGLKQSTATPEGLGNLFAIMGHQQDLQPMYGDPDAAFAYEGRAAGNDVLSAIFGSPDVSRAVADQAQQFSGVSSSILKKLLPVLAGILISGLMGGKSGRASAPQAPVPAPDAGGGLGDILGQIFGRGIGPAGPSSSPQQTPVPGGVPTDPQMQPAPGGDLLSQILQELQKGIQEGRIKPVIIGGGPDGQGGSVQIPMPGGQRGPVRIPMPSGRDETAPSGPQTQGGDILGQILRDMLGGGPGRASQSPGQSRDLKDLSDLSKQLGAMDSVGGKVFGDRFEVGRDVERDHLDNIQRVFDRFYGTR